MYFKIGFELADYRSKKQKDEEKEEEERLNQFKIKEGDE